MRVCACVCTRARRRMTVGWGRPEEGKQRVGPGHLLFLLLSRCVEIPVIRSSKEGPSLVNSTQQVSVEHKDVHYPLRMHSDPHLRPCPQGAHEHTGGRQGQAPSTALPASAPLQGHLEDPPVTRPTGCPGLDLPGLRGQEQTLLKHKYQEGFLPAQSLTGNRGQGREASAVPSPPAAGRPPDHAAG